MDVWHSHSARYQRPDVVHRWATLESKSDAMAADLVRVHAETADASAGKRLSFGVLCEMLLVAVSTWLHVRRH